MGKISQSTKTMNRGRGKIFDDLRRLNEMISARQSGVGPSELARRYGVDHSTIIYHCRRNGVTKENVERVVVTQKVRISTKLRGFAVYTDKFEGRINPGKSYADYLIEQRERKVVARCGSVASLFTNMITGTVFNGTI